MKKLFHFIIFLALGQASQAQSEVIFRIDHRLDGKAFALNQEATSPKGTKYKVTRLQFYLSGLKITHDGGQELSLASVYLFVDPSKQSSNQFSLGNLNNINTIEKIEFACGVDAASNHLDPASFPINHPLAPKNPTMHWGWTAGYRFISLSANAARTNGSFLDAVNIEGLGDSNYKIKSYPVSGTLENGKIYINMVAEYNKLLEEIVIAGGATNHGETGSAAVLVANASQIVFSPAAPVSTKEVFNNNLSEVIYTSSDIQVKYSFPSNINMTFKLYDVNGNTIQQSKLQEKEGTITLENQLNVGNYFYSFTNGNQTISTGKVSKR